MILTTFYIMKSLNCYSSTAESLVKKSHWNVDKDQEGIERTAAGDYAFIKVIYFEILFFFIRFLVFILEFRKSPIWSSRWEKINIVV